MIYDGNETTQLLNKAIASKQFNQLSVDGNKLVWEEDCCCSGKFALIFKLENGDWAFVDWWLTECMMSLHEHQDCITDEFKRGEITGKRYAELLKQCQNNFDYGHSPHISSFAQVDDAINEMCRDIESKLEKGCA